MDMAPVSIMNLYPGGVKTHNQNGCHECDVALGQYHTCPTAKIVYTIINPKQIQVSTRYPVTYSGNVVTSKLAAKESIDMENKHLNMVSLHEEQLNGRLKIHWRIPLVSLLL